MEIFGFFYGNVNRVVPYVSYNFEHLIINENTFKLVQTFHHCTEDSPSKARLFRKHLNVCVTSFKRQKDFTPYNAITDVTFAHFTVINDVKAACAFRTVTIF